MSAIPFPASAANMVFRFEKSERVDPEDSAAEIYSLEMFQQSRSGTLWRFPFVKSYGDQMPERGKCCEPGAVAELPPELNLKNPTETLEDLAIGWTAVGWKLFALLIVTLATKNTVKKTKQNKLASLGIGKARHQYTTYLDIDPAVLAAKAQGGAGARHSPRVHLRRGHVRTQRHGAGLAEVKKVFIEPVWVNAALDTSEPQRRQYKLTGAAGCA